jgi:hypothetical protein
MTIHIVPFFNGAISNDLATAVHGSIVVYFSFAF